MAFTATAAAAAQPPRPPPDTARLAPVIVSVTRTPTARDRAPWAVAVVDARALRAGRLTVGLDEAVADVPGVFVANRYNFSVDQRLSVRGFGARANFGTRGVRLLLDGVPQTFPDGQSQLTNVDLANLERVEVLRGAASSLYGNASGGVLDFRTDVSAPARGVGGRGQAVYGAYGVRKAQGRAAGRLGDATLALSGSLTGVSGFRDRSRAEQRRLTLAADRPLGGYTVASARLHLAADPRAENPGALTAAEFAADPGRAALANVRRGADKRVDQQQLAFLVRREGPDGARLELTTHAVRRALWNPLATPAPGAPTNPAAPGGDAGTLVTIGRWAGGARAAGALPLARLLPAGTLGGALPAALRGARAPVLTLGLDWQAMRDARANRRTTGGRTDLPADTLFLDQVERVEALAPFAQVSWAPTPRLTLDAGARRDRVRFAVRDRFVADGGDDSGARTLSATSGHAGATYAAHPAFVPYVNTSTAFETPTTTELQATPPPDDFAPGGGSTGGFNRALAPQRARGAEVGARGAVGSGRLTYSLSAYRARVDDAIVQWLETNGRAYFRNAGRTQSRGVELGLSARPLPARGLPDDALVLTAAYTRARLRFADYRVRTGARVDTLDGRTVPGVPERFVRVGVRSRPLAFAARLAPLALDADHTWASRVYGDDRNTLRAADWGRGLLDVRLRWDGGGIPGALGALRPFASVQNALGQRYVGSVTVNGAGGRVLEPSPGRTAYVGLAVGG